MSYIRGTEYFWRDDKHLHVWAEDGYDGWDEAGWTPGPADEAGSSVSVGAAQPSGVRIRQDVVDEYVVMRFAELVRTGIVDATIHRALVRHSGNGGCDALRQEAPALRRSVGSRQEE